MTSKEALECIVVDLTPKAKEHNKEEIEQLEKDLEVLEILKNWFKNSYTDSSFTQIIIDTDEIEQSEIDKIEEWLENENNINI